ncbi:CbiX/SirB N-terminal domain-containing protein [Marinobacter lutaoensis]|jgi:sirohydrochlorin cobaltochelatase|uniref:Cobalamin biosynthesis protein CbiX n=1 Tax=Marinobacter lutaoensis TaxID=135739 RepID=A0A1V2DUF2_9GAMM|nr:CbiX/SirB N-terminal domain-containing protein [Marinobacter lutaoensis]MBI42142.1 cobalamin biosynthesis protein CbiX [Oceanospirillales bacterium]NVD35043.1 CbiX/SirB N-terminal domain-containing protein [Marinobacter lutaoensis]ONF44006.1 cobalamin biosynthesis protein CbiX [Marinobacter lutaoensis]
MTRHRIILLAHGSSDPRWCETFEAMAAPTLDAHPNARVAYMELAHPSLAEAVEHAVGDGIEQITVIPLFLAAGRHLRNDIPAMIQALEQRHGIPIRLDRPVGEHPRLGTAIRDIVTDTLAEAP